MDYEVPPETIPNAAFTYLSTFGRTIESGGEGWVVRRKVKTPKRPEVIEHYSHGTTVAKACLEAVNRDLRQKFNGDPGYRELRAIQFALIKHINKHGGLRVGESESHESVVASIREREQTTREEANAEGNYSDSVQEEIRSGERKSWMARGWNKPGRKKGQTRAAIAAATENQGA